jgi:hypothetical protein
MQNLCQRDSVDAYSENGDLVDAYSEGLGRRLIGGMGMQSLRHLRLNYESFCCSIFGFARAQAVDVDRDLAADCKQCALCSPECLRLSRVLPLAFGG